IVGELDLRILVARRGEEDQGEPPLLAVHPAQLLKAEQIEETDRLLGIGNADHRVQIFHRLTVADQKTPASISLPDAPDQCSGSDCLLSIHRYKCTVHRRCAKAHLAGAALVRAWRGA